MFNTWRILSRRSIQRLSFSFRLRTLLVSIIFIAAFFSWIVNDLARVRVQRRLVSQIKAAGGDVYFEHQIVDGFIRQDIPSPGSKAIRNLFGDDIYARVSTVLLIDPKTCDNDTAQLHRLSRLAEIALQGKGISDKCVDELLQVRQLRSLHLLNTSISPSALARLSTTVSLQSLTLQGSNVTDRHLAQLASFPNLTVLQIVKASVTDEGLRAIGQISRLRQLDICGCSAVTGNSIDTLDQLSNLERLQLDFRPSITDASLASVAKMRRLRSLFLHGPLTDVGIRQLKQLTALEKLSLSGKDVTDDSLETIISLSRLTSLDLSGTGISDAGLSLLQALHNLVELNLEDTNVTNSGLQRLAGLSSLLTLHVTMKDGVTYEGIDTLKLRLPECSIMCWESEADGSSMLAEIR